MSRFEQAEVEHYLGEERRKEARRGLKKVTAEQLKRIFQSKTETYNFFQFDCRLLHL